MQFYIIDKDPKTSTRNLPDYALKSVNLREGWQGLSDIGHAVGVTWEGQNKAYNITHPNTMRYYRSRESFTEFFENYIENLIEYEIRFKKSTVWHEKIANVPYHKLINAIPESDDKYQTVIRYMLNHKSKHLTEDEINMLGEKIENNNQIKA